MPITAPSRLGPRTPLRRPTATRTCARRTLATPRFASIESGKQDLRSPDARDAGREPTTVPVPEPVEVREVPGGGFDWGDAGIGAAGLRALLSIAGGVTLLAVGRRRRRDIEAPAH
jgi:hypothetical protein